MQSVLVSGTLLVWSFASDTKLQYYIKLDVFCYPTEQLTLQQCGALS